MSSTEVPRRRPDSLVRHQGTRPNSARITLAEISILPAPDGTFIHPRAADPTKLSSSPSPQPPLTCNRLEPPTFRAFLRHRSTLVAFLRQAGFVALAARQPPGTGSAQILRSMSPNSRRRYVKLCNFRFMAEGVIG